MAREPKRHIEAGRPGPHREGVQCDQVALPERVAGEERDVAVRHRALALSADPVVRGARRTARFIDRHPLEANPTVQAARLERIRVDVAVLIRLRKRVEDARGREPVRVDPNRSQVRAVGGDAPDGAPHGPLGAQATGHGQDPCRHGIEQALQPAIPHPDDAEHEVEREEPDVAAQPEQPGHDMSPEYPRGRPRFGWLSRGRGVHGADPGAGARVGCMVRRMRDWAHCSAVEATKGATLAAELGLAESRRRS